MPWTAPIDWTAGSTVTAAQMNIEVRDHLNWLKGALNIVTDSTVTDTGTSTRLRIVRAVIGDKVFSTFAAADTYDRLNINAGGDHSWGPGGATQDATLSRIGPANMGLVGRLDISGGGLGVTGTIAGSNTGLALNLDAGGYIEFLERAADPAAPGVNQADLYARDNGAGKTQLVIRFNTGTSIVLATQA